MENKPLVSIITPTYNHEKFIGTCLESVLSQTYSNWELIVIDDGSSDRTGFVVSQYNDKRIRYIRQNNQGIWKLGEIYNKALQLSKGDYIAVLEGDDFWPPYKLELQTNSLERSNAVLSWGKAKIIDSQGNFIETLPDNMAHYIGLPKYKFFSELLFDNPIPSSSVVCHKSALLSIGGFKQPSGLPYVDEPTWLQLCLMGEFLPIDEVLGCYRRHERQVTSSMKTAMIKASRYSIDFFDGLPAEVKSLVLENVPGLCEKLERKNIEYSYYLGRANLTEGKHFEANRHFLKAMREGHPTLKAKALVGIISNLCRKDMDWLDALSRKVRR